MENLNKTGLDIPSLIEFRRWMHQNAELSFKEFNTQQRVKQYLLKLGVPESAIKPCAITGFVIDLQGTGEAKGEKFMIALRADLDGLPIKEKNEHLEYRSTGEAAHMCGHDGHTAALLGGVSLIVKNLDKLPSNKTVRFLFQPAEEGNRGASVMIKEGCMEGVDEVYGLHNFPRSGYDKKILIADKEMMAQITIYDIKVSYKLLNLPRSKV